jgi:L-lactate utilization protein LutB
MMHRRLLSLSVVAVAALAFAPAAWGQERRHPHLVAALGEMKEARNEVREAKHDFDGHRDKTLRALDEAIEQVDKALRAVRVESRFVPPARSSYDRYPNHPHLRHSLVELREARTELRESRDDFGGHRDRAVQALDVAIRQLEETIRFAR